jgi:hypothetical protein
VVRLGSNVKINLQGIMYRVIERSRNGNLRKAKMKKNISIYLNFHYKIEIFVEIALKNVGYFAYLHHLIL